MSPSMQKTMALPSPYYEDEAVTIYHGDCREILPLMPPKSIDLVLTDPPYEDEAHTAMRRTRATIEGRESAAGMPFAPITEDLRRLLVSEAIRLSGGWALVFCQAEAVGTYRNLFGEAWRRPMIWVKPDAAPQFSGDRPSMGYESICAAWCGRGKSSWNGGGARGVFHCNATDFDHLHPAQKPSRLMNRLVGLFSHSRDLILDPFMGSGTTLRAAKDLGRKAIGIEIDERWCELVVHQMAQGVLL